jgi:hypothetical protein
VGAFYTALFYRWLDKLSPGILAKMDNRIFGMLLPDDRDRPAGSVISRPMAFAEIDELATAIETHPKRGKIDGSTGPKGAKEGSSTAGRANPSSRRGCFS